LTEALCASSVTSVNTWEEVCVDVARSHKMERYKVHVDVVRSY